MQSFENKEKIVKKNITRIFYQFFFVEGIAKDFCMYIFWISISGHRAVCYFSLNEGHGSTCLSLASYSWPIPRGVRSLENCWPNVESCMCEVANLEGPHLRFGFRLHSK